MYMNEKNKLYDKDTFVTMVTFKYKHCFLKRIFKRWFMMLQTHFLQ